MGCFSFLSLKRGQDTAILCGCWTGGAIVATTVLFILNPKKQPFNQQPSLLPFHWKFSTILCSIPKMVFNGCFVLQRKSFFWVGHVSNATSNSTYQELILQSFDSQRRFTSTSKSLWQLAGVAYMNDSFLKEPNTKNKKNASTHWEKKELLPLDIAI